MSNGIAPLPTGGGVTVIAEHRSRRDPDQHRAADDDERGSGSEHRHPEDRQPRPHHGSPNVPVLDESTVPAETLFETALLANRLMPTTVSHNEILLRQNHEWIPPESGLRLKDKLI
jgi:hypothetical protein